jgi:hypothetical protein
MTMDDKNPESRTIQRMALRGGPHPRLRSTDGITLCGEPPAAVNEGEIVVASNEELHAARLSAKRLLALWNALPRVGLWLRLG